MAVNDTAAKYEMVKFYTERNTPKFRDLLSVKDRVPALAKALGAATLGKLLMAEISMFVASYTVVRPMNEDQIAQCAMALISTSEEDYLSLQDFVVFFDGAKQGKYGRVLDHIDQHVIFEMLEQYRESRHQTYLAVKEEKEAQYKTSATAAPRSSDSNTDKEKVDSIRKVMVEHYKKSVNQQQ